MKNISIGNTYNHVSNPILTKNENNLVTVVYENSTIDATTAQKENTYYNTSIKSYTYNNDVQIDSDDMGY